MNETLVSNHLQIFVKFVKPTDFTDLHVMTLYYKRWTDLTECMLILLIVSLDVKILLLML